MEYLFGLVLTLCKVSVQAFCYSLLVFKLTKLYAKHNPASWAARTAQQEKVFRRRAWLFFAGALFAFACTYWGDHGLGDSARLPLGNGEVMEELNVDAYFEATVPYEHPTDQPIVDSFRVANDVLCAKGPDDFYFTYDLATKTSHTFTSAEEYTSYAASQNLPSIGQFQSFDWHYHDYWGGWRFWLLA